MTLPPPFPGCSPNVVSTATMEETQLPTSHYLWQQPTPEQPKYLTERRELGQPPAAGQSTPVTASKTEPSLKEHPWTGEGPGWIAGKRLAPSPYSLHLSSSFNLWFLISCHQLSLAWVDLGNANLISRRVPLILLRIITIVLLIIYNTSVVY